MPNIDLSILNQRQTPAFYADVFANRPAAGFVGRIFVSTDTYAFYRDNGTGWDLIGGPGTGTVTGSGAAGQVAFWSGSSLISGENNLWWDSTNNHFGINTNTPGTAADIHHDQSTILQLNQTTATNDTRIAFQNAGSSKWRVGNFYSAGSNDYKVNDAVLNINRFTIKSSSGQTFVGDETTSSGLFVVNNSSGDAHIVALGATAPSIRVRNAGVGASLQFGLGLATTTNNFIQGATGGEFCIFNDSLTAQPILFGIKDAGLGNTQEAARISAARNFLIGTTTDAGQKLQVTGSTLITGNSVDIFTATGIGSSAASGLMRVISGGTSVALAVGQSNSTRYTGIGANFINVYNDDFFLTTTGAFPLSIGTNNTARLTITSGGNVGIGTTTATSKLQISSSFAGVATVAAFLLNENTNVGTETRLAFAANTNNDITTNRYSYISAINTSGSNGQALTFATNATGSAAVEAMRISSSQNVLIGTTTDNGYKLQVNGSSYFNNYLIANTTIGKNGQSGTIANNSTVSINLNGFGGNLSAGFIACTASVNSSSFNSVIIITQIHTNGYNLYSTLASRNDDPGMTCTLVGTAIDIVNVSGYAGKYNCRYINFCDYESWLNGV